MGEWTLVVDEPPDAVDDVLVSDGAEVWLGYMDEDGTWRCPVTEGRFQIAPVWWLPVPPPPDDE
jgi:hypothetical protein